MRGPAATPWPGGLARNAGAPVRRRSRPSGRTAASRMAHISASALRLCYAGGFSPRRQHHSQARSCCTTGSTKVMCNVIGPLEPSSNTRSLLRVAPNPRTTPCLPLRRGPAASQTTTRSPTVQSWSVLSLAHVTLSVPGLYPPQLQPRRKRHAVNDRTSGPSVSDTPRNAARLA